MAVQDPTTAPSTTQIQPTRQRGQGRIFPRKGSPYFWCAYFLRGREFRESTRETDPRKAERFLNRRMKEIGADQIGAKAFAGPSQERVLVNELLDDLEAEYQLGGKQRIPRKISPQMRSHLKRIRQHFGAMRAFMVRRHHIQDFISQLKSEGKKNATVNRSLQLLGQAYRLAVACDPPKLSRALKIPKLDESDNVRKGKFTLTEVIRVSASLPSYLGDVARFAYETGARAGEILKLCWSHVSRDSIEVPAALTKRRKDRSIAITPEMAEILERRRAGRVPGCDLIFHNGGHPIRDYRKAWHTACVMNGLGKFYCRNCRNETGELDSVLDAERKCGRCGKHWDNPKYAGRIMHDFRRSAAYEMWRSGSTVEECMEVTGHATAAMFKRYADLFSDTERQMIQRKVQEQRIRWRDEQIRQMTVASITMN